MKTELVAKLTDVSRFGYEDIGASFSITRQKYFWPEIDDLVKRIKPGERIADIGCGNGRLLSRLPEGIKYLGLDSSKTLVRLAREQFPNYSFVVGDATRMDMVKEGGFDWAISLAVWHHMAGSNLQVRFLDEIARILKSEGRAIITVWDIANNDKLKRMVLKSRLLAVLSLRFSLWNELIFPWKDDKGKEIGSRYYHIFSPKEIQRLVSSSCLKLVSLEKKGGNYWIELIKK
jgi:SAM-dependent methyltransferase